MLAHMVVKCTVWTQHNDIMVVKVSTDLLRVGPLSEENSDSVYNQISDNHAPKTDILSYFPSSNEPWQVKHGTSSHAGRKPAGRGNIWTQPREIYFIKSAIL